MGTRPHSNELPPLRPSVTARRGSAPYAERGRGYVRTLSSTSVGLEMAIAVVLPLLFGIWLDRKLDSGPWLMLLCLGFGFAAGVRAVWRHVAASDREVAESEEAAADLAADRARGASASGPST